MILLNTTFSVDDNTVDDFISFMRDVYIPAAISCGLFAPLLSRVRTEDQENFFTKRPSFSYALQMQASEEDLEKFKSMHLPSLCDCMSRRWGPSAGMFETVLDIVFSLEMKDGKGN